MKFALLLLLVALAPTGATSDGPTVVGAAARAPDVIPGGVLRVERGPGLRAVSVPRDEELSFDVLVDAGLLGDLDVGDVKLSSGVEPYKPGLPAARDKSKSGAPLAAGAEVAWMKSLATGSYLGYTLRHELATRFLPQSYPSILYKDTQSGSENRRRELRIGTKDGVLSANFRSDGHCKGCDNPEHFVESKWLWGDAAHCKKCKILEHRVWKEPVERAVPEGTVDMLGAVYLARSLVREGWPEATMPLIDRQKIWRVSLTRGARRRIETELGRYDCQQVVLATTFVAEENPNEEDAGGQQFQGLFGIQGKIQIWLEAHTGVPVLIQGELPVSIPFVDKIDVRVALKAARGVPIEFQTVK